MEVVGPISGDGRHVANSCSRWHAAAGSALFCGFRRDDCRYDPRADPGDSDRFIAVTICVIGSNYLLFDASELADPAFKASKQALKWGLAGFSSTTVWLVFGAFIFALGYEVTGLGRRIALFLVKFMGKRTLTLGYAIVIIDILLAPFTPSIRLVPAGLSSRSSRTCRRCLNRFQTILPHAASAVI